MAVQAKEIQIRKQFNEAVKTQQRQYKALKEHILQNTPKAEQKAVVKKLKDEQMRKLASLGDQYEASIAEMLQQQNVRMFSYLIAMFSVVVTNSCVFVYTQSCLYQKLYVCSGVHRCPILVIVCSSLILSLIV